MKCTALKSGLLAVVAAVGIVALAPLPAMAQDSLAGTWELTLETPQGANTVNMDLKQDADKVTGELTSPLGAVPVSGTYTGGTMALTANIDIQGTALTLGFNGKVTGNSIAGSVKLGDFGEFPFSGARKAAGSAAAAAPAAPAATTPAAPAAAAAGGGGGAGGAWDVVLSIPGVGDLPATATLTQDGQNVTGMLSSMAGDVPVKGTMIGNALKLEFTAETPQGPITVTMTGELAATGFTGKASLAGIGEADWKATRK